MSNLHQLYRLQMMDTAVLEEKARLTQILQSQKEPQPLIDLRTAHRQWLAEQRRLQAAVREKELAAGSVNARLKETNERLYSGKERNPKALQDLQQEAEYLARHRADLEEQLLEFLVELEDVEGQLAETTAELERFEQDWSAERENLQAQQLQSATHLNDLLAQRQAQAGRIEPATLKLYDGLLKSKRGVAVALMKHGECQGCRVSLTSNILRAVSLGEMIHCPTCGRLLFGEG